ncbi:hypothetical protein NX059_000929 [Plenodomus lindquistii]|nr:hypothetical protein NX059_000929 [Plenodomus lindquistii]
MPDHRNPNLSQPSLAPESAPRISDEFEVPTAPGSPALGPFTSRPVTLAPPQPDPRIARDIPIEAHQSLCAVCKGRLHKSSKRSRINHINACWGELREVAANAKKARLAEKTDLDIAVTVLERASKNSKQELRAQNAELDAVFAHADTEIGDFGPVMRIQATGAGDIDAYGSSLAPDVVSTMSSTIETMLPMSPTATILPPPPDTPPKTCVMCSKTLSLSAIDALLHQRHCLSQAYPPHCPVCGTNFPSSPPKPSLPPSPSSTTNAATPGNNWTPDTVLEHLDFCFCRSPPSQPQHHEEFIRIMKSCDRPWGLARRLLERRFGPRKNWRGRDHRQSRARKMQGKMSEDGTAYAIGPTSLRTAVRYVGRDNGVDRFEATICKRTRHWKAMKMDEFRRLVFNKLFETVNTRFARPIKLERVEVFVIPLMQELDWGSVRDHRTRLATQYRNESRTIAPMAPGKSSIVTNVLERDKKTWYTRRTGSRIGKEKAAGIGSSGASSSPPRFRSLTTTAARLDAALNGSRPSPTTSFPSRSYASVAAATPPADPATRPASSGRHPEDEAP